LRGPHHVVAGPEGQIVLVDEGSQAAVVEADEDFQGPARVAALAGVGPDHGAFGGADEGSEATAAQGRAQHAADDGSGHGAARRIALLVAQGFPHVLDPAVEHPVSLRRGWPKSVVLTSVVAQAGEQRGQQDQ
jgi:hypothetical protein